MDVGNGAFDARELFVVAPALVGVGLGKGGQLGRPLRVRPLEDGEARLGRDEVGDRDRRGGGVELEGLAAFDLAWGGSGTAASSRS